MSLWFIHRQHYYTIDNIIFDSIWINSKNSILSSLNKFILFKPLKNIGYGYNTKIQLQRYNKKIEIDINKNLNSEQNFMYLHFGCARVGYIMNNDTSEIIKTIKLTDGDIVLIGGDLESHKLKFLIPKKDNSHKCISCIIN